MENEILFVIFIENNSDDYAYDGEENLKMQL
jgi:hypothetical protein